MIHQRINYKQCCLANCSSHLGCVDEGLTAKNFKFLLLPNVSCVANQYAVPMNKHLVRKARRFQEVCRDILKQTASKLTSFCVNGDRCAILDRCNTFSENKKAKILMIIY